MVCKTSSDTHILAPEYVQTGLITRSGGLVNKADRQAYLNWLPMAGLEPPLNNFDVRNADGCYSDDRHHSKVTYLY